MSKQLSKTAQAVAWVLEDPIGRTGYQAATKFGLSQPAMYRALRAAKKKAGTNLCPTCGKPI